MKKIVLSIVLLLFVQIAFSQGKKNNKGKQKMENRPNRGQKQHKMDDDDHGNGDNDHEKLRHVVVFKFKDGTTAADIKIVEDGFRELPKKIKFIKGYEWGTNNSPENLNQGFTHCFLVTFKSEADRDAYIIHPDHKAFVSLLGQLDKAFVVDYWAKD